MLHQYRTTKMPGALAIQYDGSQESIAALRKLVPNAVINGPIGYGDQFMIDGQLHSKSEWVVRKDGQYRVLSEDDFDAESKTE